MIRRNSMARQSPAQGSAMELPQEARSQMEFGNEENSSLPKSARVSLAQDDGSLEANWRSSPGLRFGDLPGDFFFVLGAEVVRGEVALVGAPLDRADGDDAAQAAGQENLFGLQ